MIGAALALALLTEPAGQVIDPKDVNWAKLPAAEEVAFRMPHHMPDGKVVLLCVVGADGTLEDCAVESCEPDDARLSTHALRVASAFRMLDRTKSGRSTSGLRVRVPFVFQTVDDEPAAGRPDQ